MSTCNPAQLSINSDLYPTAVDIAGAFDLITVGRAEEKAVLHARAGADVQAAEFTRDYIGNYLATALLDRRRSAFNRYIHLTCVNPAFKG